MVQEGLLTNSVDPPQSEAPRQTCKLHVSLWRIPKETLNSLRSVYYGVHNEPIEMKGTMMLTIVVVVMLKTMVLEQLVKGRNVLAIHLRYSK